MILAIVGNVYMGKFYSIKLQQVLVVSDDGIKLSLPNIINIFNIRKTEDDLKWHDIIDVKLLDNKNGPLLIRTCRGDFSFWHPLENKTNLQIIEIINSKLQNK